MTVSVPAAAGMASLSYWVVNRALAVQSLGFSLAPGGL